MEKDRQLWSLGHARLREALKKPKEMQPVLDCFLPVHAAVHRAEISGSGEWSFTDEVWQGVTPDLARQVPPGGEHSFIWIFWHLARIEDITMNLLAAGQPQVLDREDWLKPLRAPFRHAGNEISAHELAELNAAIDVDALLAYRDAVGKSTRAVVSALDVENLAQKTAPSRLRQVMEQGDLLPAATGPIDYWGGLTLAGLLLMPPTRHCVLHHNEALRLRKKLKIN